MCEVEIAVKNPKVLEQYNIIDKYHVVTRHGGWGGSYRAKAEKPDLDCGSSVVTVMCYCTRKHTPNLSR